MQRLFTKKCFLFTVGSVPRVKRFTTGSRNSQGRSKVADDVRPGAEVAETTVKRQLFCGFRRTGKAMGHVNQCWWTICREINVFPRLEYHMFCVLYPSVRPIYWLSLVWSGWHVTQSICSTNENTSHNMWATLRRKKSRVSKYMRISHQHRNIRSMLKTGTYNVLVITHIG
jgi:hypothetical protein